MLQKTLQNSPINMHPPENLIPYLARNQNRNNGNDIILLTSDLNKSPKAQSIINMGLALTHLGYKVRVVTNSIDGPYWEHAMTKLKIKVIRSWLPSSIVGRMKTQFGILRTISLAFWTTAYSCGRGKPGIIITDTCGISIPVLKLFGNFKIIFCQYFFQLENIINTKFILSITPRWIHKLCLRWSDEIIVQNLMTVKVFNNTFGYSRVPKVLYPCIDTGKMEYENNILIQKIIPNLEKHCMIFLTFGEYRPRSNFEIAIDAFEMLYTRLKRKNVDTTHLRLVIAGKYSERLSEQRKYYGHLIDKAINLNCSNSVVFLKQLPTVYKKTVLAYCIAVLHTPRNDIFGTQILEAMYMGRPVIASADGVATEYMNDDIGYLVNPYANDYAEAMYNVIKDETAAEKMGTEAKKHFIQTFCFTKFAERLSHYVDHILPLEPQPFMDCVSEMGISNRRNAKTMKRQI